MNPTQDDIDRPVDQVLYHSPCLDGSCAAWVASLKHPGAEYVPCVPSRPPGVSSRGRHVLMLDVAYDRQEMIRIASEAASVVVLDHHETNHEQLADLPFYLFDPNHSGARMAWDYFNPGERVPWIVDYVEDGDFWRFQLRGSQLVRCHLEMLPRDNWDAWTQAAASSPEAVMGLGWVSYATKKQVVLDTVSSAFLADLGGHQVPVAVASAYWSEVAGELSKGALFGATVRQVPDGAWVYSLRSSGDFSVAEVAKKFGGGGHRQSAGFSVPQPVHRYLGSWKTLDLHLSRMSMGTRVETKPCGLCGSARGSAEKVGPGDPVEPIKILYCTHESHKQPRGQVPQGATHGHHDLPKHPDADPTPAGEPPAP